MLPLASMTPGHAVCRHIEGDGPIVNRLKQLGICSGRSIEVVRAGDPMILRVVGTRVGLSKQLAGLVLVERPLDSGGETVHTGCDLSVKT